MRVLSRGALELVVDLAQRAYAKGVCTPNPPVGSLVFEPTLLWCHGGDAVQRRPADIDAIGWLVQSGLAPYLTEQQARAQRLAGKDPTPDARLVWDIMPLSGRRGRMSDSILMAFGVPRPNVLRYENAEFWALPNDIAELVRG